MKAFIAFLLLIVVGAIGQTQPMPPYAAPFQSIPHRDTIIHNDTGVSITCDSISGVNGVKVVCATAYRATIGLDSVAFARGAIYWMEGKKRFTSGYDSANSAISTATWTLTKLGLDADTSVFANIFVHSNTAGSVPAIGLQRSRGTKAAPIADSTGTILGTINIYGKLGKTLAARVQATATESQVTNLGTRLDFAVGTQANTTTTTALSLRSDSGVVRVPAYMLSSLKVIDSINVNGSKNWFGPHSGSVPADWATNGMMFRDSIAGNVIQIQMLDHSGYSAIRTVSDSGHEKGAWGYGNGDDFFGKTVFNEAYSDLAGVFTPYHIVGTLPVVGSVDRLNFAADGTESMYARDPANGNYGGGLEFRNYAGSGSVLISADSNTFWAARNATYGSGTNIHNYGGTLASGDGFKLWSGGGLASQTVKFNQGDDSAAFFIPLRAPQLSAPVIIQNYQQVATISGVDSSLSGGVPIQGMANESTILGTTPGGGGSPTITQLQKTDGDTVLTLEASIPFQEIIGSGDSLDMDTIAVLRNGGVISFNNGIGSAKLHFPTNPLVLKGKPFTVEACFNAVAGSDTLYYPDQGVSISTQSSPQAIPFNDDPLTGDNTCAQTYQWNRATGYWVITSRVTKGM